MHVLEARKLLGGQLNPIVKVVCGATIKETSSRKGTNNPLFDEVLYIQYIHTHLTRYTTYTLDEVLYIHTHLQQRLCARVKHYLLFSGAQGIFQLHASVGLETVFM